MAAQKGGAASLSAGMVRAFQGVSPALAADLCDAAGVPSDSAAEALSAQQWGALHGAWLAWLERIKNSNKFGAWAASMSPEQNRYSMVGIGSEAVPGGANAAVDDYFSRIQASHRQPPVTRFHVFIKSMFAQPAQHRGGSLILPDSGM